jgi:translation initiation factor IF-2
MLGRTPGGGMPAGGGAPRLGGTPGGGPGGGRTPAGATPGRCGSASEGTPWGRPGGGPGGRRMPAGGTPGRAGAAAPPPSMPGGPGSPSNLQERMFINFFRALTKNAILSRHLIADYSTYFF